MDMATSPKNLHPAKVDGRRERSAASRRQILAAMIDLVESGQPSPTAETVAARAGVSLRTVFRHFEEMEKLHLELAAVVFERVRPILDRPIEQREWPDSLTDAIARRAEFFEMMAPFKTAIDVHRHRSRAIAAQHRRITVMSRDLLAASVPSQLLADREKFELLSLLLSLEAWQRLREQQGLTVEESRQAVLRAARALIASEG
ncbi:TetR/AcrR family transcriptional regulator [Sandaracinobacter neustonicus]|uniref:TetR/AcrR family transcriptional regulator n=1 Tax=Sandaracinobacter neustonicus TaxID=1715348 RepID=A0A501XMB5_9SPHN|nr:TetR/AcrR family transcriptional regulator [Sandaracinobacter neustonicus]TPE61788.1 TetR/AcrR family transcriptional regulator [Sandaracinobacter neustonicus]